MSFFKKITVKTKPLDWHARIDSLTNGISLIEGSQLNSNYPWAVMLSETQSFMKEKKLLTPGTQDIFLMKLIQGHAKTHAAIAACAKFMSAQFLKDNIASFAKFQSPCNANLSEYLHCLIAANLTNKDAVQDTEITWAYALLPFTDTQFVISNATIAAQRLKVLAFILTRMEKPQMLSLTLVKSVVNAVIENFSNFVNNLLRKLLLLDAYNAVKWLRDLDGAIKMNKMEQDALLSLIEPLCPHWKTWRCWDPDESRLVIWQSLDSQGRKKWQAFGCLEGPDVTGNLKSTMREGLALQTCEVSGEDETLQVLNLGSHVPIDNFGLLIRFKPPETAFTLMNRLAYAFDVYCQPKSQLKQLFEHLFASEIVDSQALETFEHVIALGHSALSGAVSKLIMSDMASDEEQFYDLVRVLAQLDYDEENKLWKLLEHKILVGLVSCFNTTREGLLTEMTADGDWVKCDLYLQTIRLFISTSVWIQPKIYPLCPSLRTFAERWPSHEQIETFHDIILKASWTENNYTSVITLIKSYCLDYLLFGKYMDPGLLLLAQTLTSQWQQYSDTKSNLKDVTVAIVNSICNDFRANQSKIEENPLWECLEYLSKFSLDTATALGDFFSENSEKMIVSCSTLAGLVTRGAEINMITTLQRLFRGRIEKNGPRLSKAALKCFKAETWWQWLRDVAVMCNFKEQDFLSDSSKHDEFPHPSSFELREWNSTLQTYTPIISTLESALGQNQTVKLILKSYREPHKHIVIRILDIVSNYKNYSEVCSSLTLCMTGYLQADGSNAEIVLSALSAVILASEDGISCCKRLCEEHPVALRQAMLSCWLQSASNMLPNDYAALKGVGLMLGLRDESSGLSEQELKAFADHIDQKVCDLVEQAKTINKLRLFLKIKDSTATEKLLKQIGMDSSAIAEEVLISLPPTLQCMIEVLGDEQLELHIPLTSFKGLRRIAMDLGDAKTLLVRLRLHPSGLPFGFCMHLDQRSKDRRAGLKCTDFHANNHLPLHFTGQNSAIAPMPDRSFCGEESRRTVYQLTRSLRRWVYGNAKSVEEIFDYVAKTLDNIADYCLVCGGTTQKDILQRATTCSRGCSKTLRRSCIGVQFVDLLTQPQVADLLLTAVHAAAASGRSVLMPDCPVATTVEAMKLLESLPKLSTIAEHGEKFSSGPHALLKPKELENFLFWSLNHHRGFLALASASLRIPSMPGTVQFILANSTPDNERRFASKLGGRTPKILFHGTTMDRLFAILSQGLINCSGTPLQAHGAAQGKGIYLCDEPRTPMGYAAAFSLQPRTGWRHSRFNNFRVLLGCEYAGDYHSPAGVWVVPNSDQLIVRFVFLVPAGAIAPVARHIVPAMESVCASLRRGTA